MIFGPLPLDRAEGAILAHSVATGGGRLRKGRVLGAEDIAALKEAGLKEVLTAQLEPGDLDENAAAALLARSLCGAGLRRTDAFTGRVNLLAEGPGVVEVDAAAIAAANAVDPMITVATVPPWQQLAEGGMAATIKIISYAVAEEALQRAAEAGAGALRLRAPVLRSARLIVTEVPGGAGEKGVPAIEGRLTALGVDLTGVDKVPHEAGALAQALGASREELVLILTGSATSDVADVAPAALRQAGGVVHRFGMPVDPGNLLFIGERDGAQVIGLPGCARSPALNGADWVLSRVICGVPVGPGDIAAMGVGGLLKEIPTRPQPRRGKKS
ncbi:MAG: molybdopterin-binding protein [Sulfitobacter sp.]|nr:molybdopterin-binding protein [Sulfitobacter sp.]